MARCVRPASGVPCPRRQAPSRGAPGTWAWRPLPLRPAVARWCASQARPCRSSARSFPCHRCARPSTHAAANVPTATVSCVACEWVDATIGGTQEPYGEWRASPTCAADAPPTHTPPAITRPEASDLRHTSIPSQIVHKQLGVRQVRQAKGRVGVAELLHRTRVRAQATGPGVMGRRVAPRGQCTRRWHPFRRHRTLGPR